MIRFDNLVRPGMTMRDIKVRFPQAAAVFEEYGFRESCDDCSLEVIARKYGLRSDELVERLNRAVQGRSS